jgi:hypothetical protein
LNYKNCEETARKEDDFRNTFEKQKKEKKEELQSFKGD